jgi:hypothetical protein
MTTLQNCQNLEATKIGIKFLVLATRSEAVHHDDWEDARPL